VVTLTIIEYDTGDDDTVREAWSVLDAVSAHDLPERLRMTLEQYTHNVRVVGDDFTMVRLIAREDGTAVGLSGAYLPLRENVHLADIQVRIHPEARRRGTGRAMFAAALAVVRAAGRRVVIGSTQSALPGGVPRPGDGGAFAMAVGGREALRSVYRRLVLAEADLSGLDAARAAAAGYSVVAWAGLTPDDLLADIAALASGVVADAPTGDLDIEPDNPDPAHYRQNELRQADAGFRAYTTAARHDATGALAAYTRLLVDPRTDLADQLGTFAAAEHRGHRLGQLVKIENILQVRAAEPTLREIFTQNAHENAHMVAINDAIGFRPHSVDIVWQLTL
jgi:GNAT superfamily N-acetyltransferase